MGYAHGEENMGLVNVEPFVVHGIEVSTTNEIEMKSGKSKIPSLWESFYKDHYGKALNGNPVYGIYTNYESDVNGQYSVIAGVKTSEDDEAYKKIEIKSGKYLVFKKEGGSPEAVVAAWQEVWNYFSNTDSPYKRAYTADFEVYEGPNNISVYIAVK